MKTEITPKKLISKRVFERKQTDLQHKHAWFVKDKTLEIRPGWMNLLDTTLTKMRRILTNSDIDCDRVEFLYCATQFRLQIFIDAAKLSDARFKVIDHLLDEARLASERTCPKCGCDFGQQSFSRSNFGCEAHRDFEGDFSEDLRRHLALKKQEKAEDENWLQRKKDEPTEAALDNSVVTSEDYAAEENVEERPRLRLYDIEDVKKIKQSLKNRSADADSRNRLRSICDDLVERGGYRPYSRVPDLDVFAALEKNYPNFSETIGIVRSAVALAKLGNGILEIPPLLLVGPPGIGKTQLANSLARLFETDFLEIRMETEQSGAGISGSSEFWSNTQTGQLFDVLTTGRTANPIVLLDELDKAGGDSRFNPVGGLYSLLERETAQRFEDQSIRGLKIDASAVIWVITANDPTLIPDPILSRVVMQHIRPPTREQSIMIANCIYESIRRSRAWGECFNPELINEVAEKLAMMEPRQMKVSLFNAFGKAAIASRSFISPDDIPDVESSGGHIGFV